MTKKSFQSLALLPIALLAVLSQAQAAPNLSGTWKLNVAKSDFGPVPPPEVMTRTVKHAEPNIEINTTQKGEQGEVSTQLKYTTDGKETTNKMQGADAKGSAKWKGETLVIDSIRDFQGSELKSSESWVLSDAGKVLTIVNHISIPQVGDFDIKFVFDKQ